jgi:hypothetical protein
MLVAAAALAIGIFLVIAVWTLWRRKPEKGDHYESGIAMSGDEPVTTTITCDWNESRGDTGLGLAGRAKHS